ncbi:hypothetical protein [Roseibium sediminis]|uniref:hypothetical protein n=1 Tax=Roseibium sediminis TaxID=1775174 RepID=UPI00123D5E3E|nr:hypothetical protein [Roseibium sediminis]
MQPDQKPLLQYISEHSRIAFDQHAIHGFRRFLRKNQGVKNWLISSDYNLGDRDRPTDVFAFTLFPIRGELQDLLNSLGEVFHADFKNLSRVHPKVKGFFKRQRTSFSICWVFPEKVKMFWRPRQSELDVARQSINETLSFLKGSNAPTWAIESITQLQNESKRKNFSVTTFNNMMFLIAAHAFFVRLIHEEAPKTEQIFWASDRDNMTEWKDGIYRTYAMLNACRNATWAGKTLDAEHLPFLVPEAGKENWFDVAVRPPDYLAAALSGLSISRSTSPFGSKKYTGILRDIIAENRNIALIKGKIREELQFTTLVTEKTPLPGGEPIRVPASDPSRE